MSNDWWIFPGFEIEQKVDGLQLPVNIVFQPDEDSRALAFVTELYGAVKVIDKDWQVTTFADNLLNFTPDPTIPGEGESGVTGICIDPEGGVFVSMIYEDAGKIKNKVVRMKSSDGITLDETIVILDDIPSTKKAHQVQDLTIGPDEKLYVNVGDGGAWEDAPQDDADLRGKVLRLNLDGSVPDDNPIPGTAIYAKGFRNPFGAVWRKSDESLYVTINGPATDDVLARVEPKGNHGWYPDMRHDALFWWHYTHAPTALDFMQNGEFHERFADELFVVLFGASYRKGPALADDMKGKKIIKMRVNDDASGIKSYDDFAIYVGEGSGAPCGLSFGPGGLYFTDLHEGKIYLVKSQPDYDFDKEADHVF